MKQATLKALGLSYYIGVEESPDGLPVFTPQEVEVLKRSKDTMTLEMLRTIYITKQSFGGTLEDVSRRIHEQEEMNQAVEEKPNPMEDIGYAPRVKPEKLQTLRDTIEMLKRGRKEEAKKQGDLF